PVVALGELQDFAAAVLSLGSSFDSRHVLLVSFFVSGRGRSTAPRSNSVKPSLVRKHPFDGLLVRLRDLGLAGESGFPAGGLLGQDVRVERVVPLQLPAPGLLEPLGGSAV